MVEEYLTDDEQLEHIKQLSAEYGPWILGAVVLGTGLVFGLRYYDNHRDQRALQAAAQFDQMASAVERDDRARARQVAGALIDAYPSSPYADQAKLTLARLYVDDGQDAKAIAPLTEVMEHSKDSELQHIARLRLARVLIDQGKPGDALKALSDPPGAFAARYHEVRGDAFYAEKNYREALSEYKTALGEAAASSMDSALLELKIADLGAVAGPASVATATPPVISNKGNP